MHGPQDSFALEAGPFGYALRGDVVLVRAQLQPLAAERLDRPARDQVDAARGQAPAARVAADPVTDLADSVLLADPAEADAADDLAALRRRERKRRSGALAPVRGRLVDPEES